MLIFKLCQIHYKLIVNLFTISEFAESEQHFSSLIQNYSWGGGLSNNSGGFSPPEVRTKKFLQFAIAGVRAV